MQLGLQVCYLAGFRKEVCSIHDPILGKTFQVFETRQKLGSSVRVAEVRYSPNAPAEERTWLNARILSRAKIVEVEDLVPGERLAPGFWYEIIAD